MTHLKSSKQHKNQQKQRKYQLSATTTTDSALPNNINTLQNKSQINVSQIPNVFHFHFHFQKLFLIFVLVFGIVVCVCCRLNKTQVNSRFQSIPPSKTITIYMTNSYILIGHQFKLSKLIEQVTSITSQCIHLAYSSKTTSPLKGS